MNLKVKLDAKSILKPALILFLICLISTAALVGTNALTSDRIAAAQLETAEKSRLIVLPEATGFEEKNGYYIGTGSAGTVGYVFETESKGYGGTVKVMTGISEGGEVTGIVILSHSETPGLGANATNEKFGNQFKQAVPENGIEVVKNKAASEGEIEALTGATITSKAVTDAVNAAIDMYNEVKGGN